MLVNDIIYTIKTIIELFKQNPFHNKHRSLYSLFCTKLNKHARYASSQYRSVRCTKRRLRFLCLNYSFCPHTLRVINLTLSMLTCRFAVDGRQRLQLRSAIQLYKYNTQILVASSCWATAAHTQLTSYNSAYMNREGRVSRLVRDWRLRTVAVKSDFVLSRGLSCLVRVWR